jgi:hypothetical protein
MKASVFYYNVGVATGGNGAAQINATTLCSYLDLIAVHFNSNEINQVIVYQPPASGMCSDKLQVARVSTGRRRRSPTTSTMG